MRFALVGFGVLWTIIAIAILWSAPAVGPFPVIKFVFPLFGVLFIIASLRIVRRIKLPDMIDEVRSLQSDLGKEQSPIQRAGSFAATPNSCPHCGAGIKDGSNVSPHGDTKCEHCGQWFNIHGRG